MLKEAIYHVNDIPFLFTVSPEAVKIRIRAARGDVGQCFLLYSDRYESPGHEIPMRLSRIATTENHDYFEGVVVSPTRRVRYLFMLVGKEGKIAWCGERGVHDDRESAGAFQCPYLSAADDGTPPSWVRDAVVYQIFPERYANGNPGNSPAGTRDWSDPAEPARDSFYGGDLQGITDRLPYLKTLGINVIYLTPIFTSPSNHKYDTSNYYEIDPYFGNLERLKAMVDTAHAQGIKVILDAVFNHSGDGFFAFRDLVEKGEQSAYKDWFFTRALPITLPPDANYESFGLHAYSMPKLNTRNAETADYLIGVAKYWIQETGIDGWRLDVANEVDHDFWRRFRKEIKALNPELLIIGEIMHQSGPWLRGDQFDGVMNYMLRDAMLAFFAKQTLTAGAFAARLDAIRMQYTDHAHAAMFNLIGSHDTERFLTACARSEWGWAEKRELKRMKLAALFQLTYTGMPMIYYGDEVGMTGGEDPGCRKPMVWEEELQNRELLSWYQQLLAIRAKQEGLRSESMQIWFIEEARNVFGFVRGEGDRAVYVVINNSPNRHSLELDAPSSLNVSTLTDLLGGSGFVLSEGKLTGSVEPYGGLMLNAISTASS